MPDERDSAQPASKSPKRTPGKEFLRGVVRHRLTHFFGIGVLLFALAPPPKETRQVRVDPDVLAALYADEAKKLGKTVLSLDERMHVESRAIEDELLYREALRLRIAEGDVIVRQRLVQKLLVLAEDIGGASEPLNDAALQECFSKTREQWKLPPAIQFVHVVGSSRDIVLGLRDQVATFTADPAHENEIPPYGESFATSRRVMGTVDDVAHAFGTEFATNISNLPLKTWSDPIQSKYGFHLVRVLANDPEKPATFDDVRGKLALDCQLRRREEAVRLYVGRLFKEYDVYLGPNKVRELTPTQRIAPRGEASEEDG